MTWIYHAKCNNCKNILKGFTEDMTEREKAAVLREAGWYYFRKIALCTKCNTPANRRRHLSQLESLQEGGRHIGAHEDKSNTQQSGEVIA